MKKCHCNSLFEQCSGEIKRFKIYSPANNTDYPNRFWGIVDYCESHKQLDEEQGFVLVSADNEERVYVL